MPCWFARVRPAVQSRQEVTPTHLNVTQADSQQELKTKLQNGRQLPGKMIRPGLDGAISLLLKCSLWSSRNPFSWVRDDVEKMVRARPGFFLRARSLCWIFPLLLSESLEQASGKPMMFCLRSLLLQWVVVAGCSLWNKLFSIDLVFAPDKSNSAKF